MCLLFPFLSVKFRARRSRSMPSTAIIIPSYDRDRTGHTPPARVHTTFGHPADDIEFDFTSTFAVGNSTPTTPTASIRRGGPSVSATTSYASINKSGRGPVARLPSDLEIAFAPPGGDSRSTIGLAFGDPDAAGIGGPSREKWTASDNRGKITLARFKVTEGIMFGATEDMSKEDARALRDETLGIKRVKIFGRS
jgi:hypothetical protein